MSEIKSYIKSKKYVLWDFDGVIKETVGLKGVAFSNLVDNANDNIRSRILDHHKQNGGVSRFKKIPLYLEWCGISVSEDNINKYLKKYSELVCDSVINSEWVCGVKSILESKKKEQMYFLITATPLHEINFILEKIFLKNIFTNIYGSPTSKKEAIAEILKNHCINITDAVMIGDNKTDFEAANAHHIDFCLREASWNKDFAKIYNGKKFSDFKN